MERREEALRAANRGMRSAWFSLPRRRSNGPASRSTDSSGTASAFILRIVLVTLVLTAAMRLLVVEAFRIPSGSMENTLQQGDFILVNKLPFGSRLPFWHLRLPGWRSPRLNELLVFDWPPEPDVTFVKRVVGLPGDTLWMQADTLLRNGVAQTEPWVQLAAQGPSAISQAWGPIIVPAGEYFVLGDNRDNSSDSRVWGTVPDSLVRGKAWRIYYSFEPDSMARVPWLSRIRWSRLGRLVH